MRIFSTGGRELRPGLPFEAEGLAHPANWSALYSAEDLARFKIAIEDRPDPEPELPATYRVSTYRIVKRLEETGLLEAANAAVERNLSAKARFYTAGTIQNDDPDALTLLRSIGADVASIMARE